MVISLTLMPTRILEIPPSVLSGSHFPITMFKLQNFKLQTQTLKASSIGSLLCPQKLLHQLPFVLVTMSLTPRSFVPIFLLLLVLLPLTVTAAYSSLHEVLRSYGLPAGLFPESVKSFNLDQTGHLEVHLDRPCLAEYESRVLFDTVVRANLSFGQLKGLEGMSQEELFLWLPVKDIIVTDPSSGLILIDIGLAYKQLSLSVFEDPPICNSQGLSIKIDGRKGIGSQDQR